MIDDSEYFAFFDTSSNERMKKKNILCCVDCETMSRNGRDLLYS